MILLAVIGDLEKSGSLFLRIYGCCRKKSAGKKNSCPYLDIIILSSPTMHGDEAKYMMEAYNTNWMSTVGKNLNEIENQIAEVVGVKYAVALCYLLVPLCVTDKFPRRE